MRLTDPKERTDKAYEAAVAIAAAIHAGTLNSGNTPDIENVNLVAKGAAWDLMSRFYGQ